MNHPTGQDDLERLPNETASRAEAAYSVAQLLTLSNRQTQEVEDAATAFELPLLTPWQRKVLTTAVKFIGYPYIWGGEFETPQSPYGAQAQGGFDCSGFVWRVYKIQPYPGAPQLAGRPARPNRRVDGRRGAEAHAHQACPPCTRLTSCSSGRAARARTRLRSTMRGSTSETAG